MLSGKILSFTFIILLFMYCVSIWFLITIIGCEFLEKLFFFNEYRDYRTIKSVVPIDTKLVFNYFQNVRKYL